MAAEFEASLVEVLVEKTLRAAQRYNVKTVLLAGGVAANQHLRDMMQAGCEQNSLKLFYPSLKLCTDNAAMIAGLAHQYYVNSQFAPLSLNAYPGLSSL
jgi:N6-L-threonylcarbamoyladenine synthase